MHPTAAKYVRRDQRRKVAANRQRVEAGRNDTGVSDRELELIRQMNAPKEIGLKTPNKHAKTDVFEI